MKIKLVAFVVFIVANLCCDAVVRQVAQSMTFNNNTPNTLFISWFADSQHASTTYSTALPANKQTVVGFDADGNYFCLSSSEPYPPNPPACDVGSYPSEGNKQWTLTGSVPNVNVAGSY